jgi:hypothetical protein
MQKTALLTLLIMLGGFIAALWTGEVVFERIPDLEDEIAYVYQARIFAGGQPYVEESSAELRAALWQPFVVNCGTDETIAGLDCEGKLFGKYPPGWPLMLALGYVVNAPWVVNPLIHMLTIALVYRFAREVFDARVGVIAATLLAISPIGWLQSGSLMAHTFALFCTTLFLYGVWRTEKGQKLVLFWGALGGLAAGMLFATRPLVAASVIAPVAVYLLGRVLFAAYQYIPLIFARRRNGGERLRVPDVMPLVYAGVLAVNAFALWAGGQLFNAAEQSYPNWTVSVPVFVATGILVAIAHMYWRRETIPPQSVPLVNQPDPQRRVRLVFLVVGLLLTGVYGTRLLTVVLAAEPDLLTERVSALESLSQAQQAVLPLVVSAVLSLVAVGFSEGIERRYPQRIIQTDNKRRNAPLTSSFTATLAPLAGLVFFALAGASLHFGFNYTTTGDATENLYLLIWDYDRVGFGEGHGRSDGGHTWERAIRNLNWDTDCYARDLFGWRVLPDTAPSTPERGNDCAKGTAGLSWVLLPVALVLGWRQRWTWLLFAVGCAVISGTMFYWINAGIYSARYYYEATSAFAIVSAVGLVRLADMLRFLRIQYVVYALFLIACTYTIVDYAPERALKLDGYGNRQATLDTVDRWRTDPEKDVLIVSYGSLGSWRQIGALMGVTSPYLDSEYVLVRDPYETRMEMLLEMFPSREVVYHHEGRFFPTRDAAEITSVGAATEQH